MSESCPIIDPSDRMTPALGSLSVFSNHIFLLFHIYIIYSVLWFYNHLQIYKLFLVYFYCYLKWQPTKVLSWITIKVTVVLSPDRNSIMWMECQSSWPPAFDRWQERAGEQGFTLITYFLSDPPGSWTCWSDQWVRV